MKKTILSATTLILFGVYTFFIRAGNSLPKTNTSVATPTETNLPPQIQPRSNVKWKDGTFIGDSVDAYYGQVKVSATFSADRLTGITFLDYPKDRITSVQKSDLAMPILKSEAISAQSAEVDTVSGVTYTSEAFINSLSSAMSQAKI